MKPGDIFKKADFTAMGDEELRQRTNVLQTIIGLGRLFRLASFTVGAVLLTGSLFVPAAIAGTVFVGTVLALAYSGARQKDCFQELEKRGIPFQQEGYMEFRRMIGFSPKERDEAAIRHAVKVQEEFDAAVKKDTVVQTDTPVPQPLTFPKPRREN